MGGRLLLTYEVSEPKPENGRGGPKFVGWSRASCAAGGTLWPRTRQL